MFEMCMFMCKLQEVQNHIVNFNIFCSTIFYALLFFISTKEFLCKTIKLLVTIAKLLSIINDFKIQSVV